MKKFNTLFFIGILMLILGVIWAYKMNKIGAIEWLLLLSGIIFGILTGIIQGWAIAREKRGEIGSGKRKLWVIGSIIILISLKVSLNILIPSYLALSESGIWLSIIFAIGGLLLGRSLFTIYGKLTVTAT
ncbi:hypothetical protein ACFVR2_04450 [Gottfriedia sp. NPDC057991]|uniref:hypothetical protein n=1 Tax=Gottfriedia sp. NPDC057991 TaxID=3346298 RepID=UPI0036D93BEA